MMSLPHYQHLQRQAELARLDRTGYHALRHEHRDLSRWLRLNPRPSHCRGDIPTPAVQRWDTKWLRKAYLDKLFPAWQPGDGDVLDAVQRLRRHTVQQAAYQRKLDRLATAIDTTGMTPLQAAMARLRIRFGGEA